MSDTTHKALVWDQTGEKKYETGSKKCVLYPQSSTGEYEKGVAWNGFKSITESPSGAEETALYANDDKYLSLYSKEDFGGTIGAFMYPDEWAECDGSKELAPGVSVGQQVRKSFGLSYVTTIGNDTEKESYGYKIHLVYGATASPSERGYETINDSPSANELSWPFSTVPIEIPGDNFRKAAHIEIDSTKADPTCLAALEKYLYGTDDVMSEDGKTVATPGTDPMLPLPAKLKELMTPASSTNTDAA